MNQFCFFAVNFFLIFSNSIYSFNHESLKVLVIGNGGREHALVWKIAQSPCVAKVFVAPGNGGTALEKKVCNVSIAADDIESLADFALKNNIGLTIVGPEAPLAQGIVDLFEQRKLQCLGPKKAAAQIEASKVFAKEFMQKYKIPTAHYATFTNVVDAQKYIEQQSFPVVIKADGLAAGKGVIIAQTKEEALKAIDQIMVKKIFGNAGKQIVIEEFLEGQEVSFIVLTDGKNIKPLPLAHDYKKINNGDSGKNTGGIGAYSPVWIPEKLQENIIDTIVKPTLKGLKDSGTPFVGFLYVGLMINSNNEPKVLEYNCRLGDPETQVIMRRLQSDLVPLCFAALNKQLDQMRINWDQKAAVGVVLTAQGYPDTYRKGDRIDLPLEHNNSIKIFHAGTTLKENNLSTSGGRVLCVTSLGGTISQAREQVYKTIQNINWPGVYYRTDIGLLDFN